jgi:hypothetical protein
MTPKEKAEELVDKFHIKVYVSFIENSIPSVINALMLYNSAKQCALIAVDEIIKFGNQAGIREPMMYWYKVKEELEKL